MDLLGRPQQTLVALRPGSIERDNRAMHKLCALDDVPEELRHNYHNLMCVVEDYSDAELGLDP